MANPLKALNLTQSLRAFNHRNFRLFFWGQLISVIGVWMQSTALQWLVYRITGSQTSLGLVTFINFLPVLLLSLYMGVIVDRFSRRTLIIITQSWFTLLTLVLTALTWLADPGPVVPAGYRQRPGYARPPVFRGGNGR
jgi:MFS family permease